MKASPSSLSSEEASAGRSALGRLLTMIGFQPVRPDVILDVILEDDMLFVEIANVGAGSAVEVSVSFTPSFTGAGGKRVPEQALFRDLAFLPPGKRIRTFLDASAAYFRRKEPRRIRADVRYRDDGGRTYQRLIEHNLAIYEDMAHARWSDA